MMKRFLVLAIFFIVGGLAAQDLPPLPGGDASGGLPPLPGQDSSTPGLPPLPGGGAPASSGTPSGLPPLPGADNSAGAPAGLPALPGQETAPAGGTSGLPPLPGQETVQPAAPALAPPSAPPSTAPAAGKKASPSASYISKHQPNIIYGGWVTPKGGGSLIRIAWASQEVLNALDRKGYTVEKETGDYVDNQWRLFTFNVPRSEMKLDVFLKQKGNKVWMRVGPHEAPAGVPLVQVQRMKQEDLKALQALRAQFKKRLTPRHRGKWDAPFDRIKQTADA